MCEFLVSRVLMVGVELYQAASPVYTVLSPLSDAAVLVVSLPASDALRRSVPSDE